MTEGKVNEDGIELRKEERFHRWNNMSEPVGKQINILNLIWVTEG